MDRDQILDHVTALAVEVEKLRGASQAHVQSLTVMGGRNKYGETEELDLELKAGDVVCIVGPTGSGKSRLLADIECLAQGDTPSGRRVLVNGTPPDPGWRYASDRKLIAQLSQNMNFVVDLTRRRVHLDACGLPHGRGPGRHRARRHRLRQRACRRALLRRCLA